MIFNYPSFLYHHREHNSPLQSSAACERLFSTAGLVFTPKRSKLSDANFERLVFLKLKGHRCRVWSEKPSTSRKNKSGKI